MKPIQTGDGSDAVQVMKSCEKWAQRNVKIDGWMQSKIPSGDTK